MYSSQAFHQTRIGHPEPVSDIASTQATIVASVLQHPVITHGPVEQERTMPATSSHSSVVPASRSGSILFESPLPSPFLGGRRPPPVISDTGNRSPSQSVVPGAQRTFVFESGPVSRARVAGTPIGRPVDVKQSGKHVNEVVYKMEDHETLKASLIGEEVNLYVGPLAKRKAKWTFYELPEDEECAINLERFCEIGTAVGGQAEDMSDVARKRVAPNDSSTDTQSCKKMHIDLTGDDSVGGMTPDDKDVFTPGVEEVVPIVRTPAEKRPRRAGVRRRSRAGSRKKSRGVGNRKEAATPVTPFPLTHNIVKPVELKPFVSVSPLSPQPSPVSDVFQDESQIGPTGLVGPRPTLKSGSYVNLFDEKALEPSANDYLFNLLETDDDGASIEETKSGNCPGDMSQCSAMNTISSSVLHMKHTRVDLSRIYPTPPSNDQTSPSTAITEDPATLKVSLERKLVTGQSSCQLDEVTQDGRHSPIEVCVKPWLLGVVNHVLVVVLSSF